MICENYIQLEHIYLNNKMLFVEIYLVYEGSDVAEKKNNPLKRVIYIISAMNASFMTNVNHQ